MSRSEKLAAIFDSIVATGLDVAGMRGTIMGALNDAAEEGRCEVGRELNAERRHAGKLADAVGRHLDKGCNCHEEALRAALTQWVDSGAESSAFSSREVPIGPGHAEPPTIPYEVAQLRETAKSFRADGDHGTAHLMERAAELLTPHRAGTSLK